MIKLIRGDATPMAKVQTFTPAGPIQAGGLYTLWCNGKSIVYQAQPGDTPASVVTAWAAAVGATTIPEFQEVLASATGNTLSLVSVTAGVPFEITATSSANVTVAETTAGHAGVNEVHQISLVGTYTGGALSVTYNFGAGNVTTAPIAYNATAASMQSAIQALTGVGAGNALVTGGGASWTVNWTGALAGTAIAPGTVNGSSLVGSGQVNITETQLGNGLSDEIQWLDVSPATYPGGSYTLTLDGKTTASIACNATAATIQSALVALPNIGSGQVNVFGSLSRADVPTAYAIHFMGTLAGTNVSQLQVTFTPPLGYTGPGPSISTLQNGGQTSSDSFQWIDLGQTESAFGVAATQCTFAVAIGGQTTPAISNVGWDGTAEHYPDKQLQSALQGLSAIGSGNCTVYGPSNQYNPGMIDGYLVRFTGSLANTRMANLTATASAGSGATVTALTVGQANTAEIQTIAIAASGGTFTLSAASQTTSAIAWNASTSTLQTRIQTDLSTTITACSVTGSGTLASPWVVTITTPANTHIALLTGNGASLTGGAGTITEVTAGSAGASEVQTITLAQGVNGGTLAVAFAGSVPSEPLAWNATAAQMQAALRSLPTVNTVSVTGGAGAPWVVTWSLTQQYVPEPLIFADGSLLTGAFSPLVSAVTVQRSAGPSHWDDPTNWSPPGVPGYLDSVYLNTPIADLLYGLEQISTFQVASNIQAISVSATGGTFTLSSGGQTTGAIAWNATAAQVGTAILAALTTNALQCSVTGAGTSTSPWVVTILGPQGASLPLLTANAGSLTGGSGTVTITANTFLLTGKYALVNGQAVALTSTGALPTGLAAATAYYLSNTNRDAKTFQLATSAGGTPIAVTTLGTQTHTVGARPASIEVNSNWTQSLGLDYLNPGGYVEYRPRELHTGLAAAGSAQITIGTGSGSGSQRINLNTDVDQVAVKVLATGGQLTPGIPPVLWTNANAASTLEIVNGDVGVAVYPGQSATVASPLKIRAGSVTLGPGATVGSVDKTGGKIVSNGAAINGAVVLS